MNTILVAVLYLLVHDVTGAETIVKYKVPYATYEECVESVPEHVAKFATTGTHEVTGYVCKPEYVKGNGI